MKNLGDILAQMGMMDIKISKQVHEEYQDKTPAMDYSQEQNAFDEQANEIGDSNKIMFRQLVKELQKEYSLGANAISRILHIEVGWVEEAIRKNNDGDINK